MNFQSVNCTRLICSFDLPERVLADALIFQLYFVNLVEDAALSNGQIVLSLPRLALTATLSSDLTWQIKDQTGLSRDEALDLVWNIAQTISVNPLNPTDQKPAF